MIADSSKHRTSADDSSPSASGASSDPPQVVRAPADTSGLPDSIRNHWVDTLLPPAWKPAARAMRLDRPVGYLLLFIPCLWGMALAPWALGTADTLVAVSLYAGLFWVGSVVMRGAGCIYNDILDRDIDIRVARTRDRPIASGEVSIPAALLLGCALLFVGAMVLFALGWRAVYWGLGVLPVVAMYPLMKRWMGAPQVILGFAFSWGIWLGWVVSGADVTIVPALLYVAGVAWTTGYDTMYGAQDLSDDSIIGVRSMTRTAARLGDRGVYGVVGGSYCIAWFALAAAIGYATSDLRFVWTLLPAGVHMVWQVASWNISDPNSALKLFRANTTCGMLVAGGLAAANVLHAAS